MRTLETHLTGQMPGLDTLKLVPGSLLDNRYKLVEQIGAGGMAVVFKAVHLMFNRPVALKILNYSGTNSDDRIALFLREAQALYDLNHPNVVRVLDSGVSSDGYYYLALELLNGETLDKWIEKNRDRDADYLGEAVRHLVAISSGIIAAHANGLIHRDLKPSNIFLHQSASGGMTVKILDFGISANADDVGEDDLSYGTRGYMSPEQRHGGAVDRRSDVYSLGVILYELLTGERPALEERGEQFSRAEGKRHRLVSPSRLNPAVPRSLDRVCQTALEEDPDNRYASVEALAAALLSAMAPRGRDVPTSVKAAGIPVARFVPVIVGAALVAFALGALVFRTATPDDTAATIAPVVAANTPKKSSAEVEQESAVPAPEVAQPVASANAPEGLLPATPSQPAIQARPAEGSRREARENETRESAVKPAAVPSEESADKDDSLSSLTEQELIANGNAALRGMNLADANRMFDEATRRFPKSADAWWGLGRVAYEQSSFKLAAQRIEKALSLKDNPQWKIVLGEAHLKTGSGVGRTNAIDIWEKVMRDYPDNTTAQKSARLHLTQIGVTVPEGDAP